MMTYHPPKILDTAPFGRRGVNLELFISIVLAFGKTRQDLLKRETRSSFLRMISYPSLLFYVIDLFHSLKRDTIQLYKMKWNTFLALALAIPSSALVRFHCSQLVTQRLDPLVNPGSIPSAHVHQIVGGVRKKSPIAILFLTINDRTPLMLLWILKKICRRNRPAHLASSVMTSRITGLQSSISAHRTVATSAFRNSATISSETPTVA